MAFMRVMTDGDKPHPCWINLDDIVSLHKPRNSTNWRIHMMDGNKLYLPRRHARKVLRALELVKK